jgi:hypothetical protein
MFDLFAALKQQDKLMTKKQIANLLDVSGRSIERMVTLGLPSMLIGGQRRFDPS